MGVFLCNELCKQHLSKARFAHRLKPFQPVLTSKMLLHFILNKMELIITSIDTHLQVYVRITDPLIRVPHLITGTK